MQSLQRILHETPYGDTYDAHHVDHLLPATIPVTIEALLFREIKMRFVRVSYLGIMGATRKQKFGSQRPDIDVQSFTYATLL